MKNKILTGKKIILASLLAFALVAGAAAQTFEFGIGDTVQTANGKTGKVESLSGDVVKVKIGNEFEYFVAKDLKKVETAPTQTFRVGEEVVSNNSGQAGIIESLSPDGKGAKVRYGKGKYDFKWEAFANLKSPSAARLDAEQEKQRKIFRVEAQPYLSAVQHFGQFYNSETAYGKGGIDEAVLKSGAVELAELDRLYKTKYPDITNKPGSDVQFDGRYADWCAIARERDSILKKAKAYFLARDTEMEISSWTMKIESTMNAGRGYVDDEMQMLVYERAAWEKKTAEYIRKRYAAAGETMPTGAFAPLYKKADELKAQIERDAPNRQWEPLKLTNAALEALARREFPADLPGAKVFKTGMTNSTWQVRDEKSLVGSDSNYKYYRITPGAYRFKFGLALIQMPNRPFCQIREFQVTQYKAGAGYGAAKASVATTGIFVKCP